MHALATKRHSKATSVEVRQQPDEAASLDVELWLPRPVRFIQFFSLSLEVFSEPEELAINRAIARSLNVCSAAGLFSPPT
jgi:hypothetical protein